jgi:hypothetical protein
VRASTLSLLPAGLAASAALTGLLIPDLYRDTGLILEGWRPNDAVTALLVFPIFLLARRGALQGSLHARLVWLGTLHYLAYNDCFYLFGAALNPLLLVYAAVLGLSLWSIALAASETDAPAVAAALAPRAPVRRLATWMLFVALGLGVTWTAQWLVALLRTTPPGRFDTTPEFVRLVAALDLTLMVGLFAPAAVLLLRRRPWGFVLAAALNVSAALYNLVLTGGTLAQIRAGLPGAWPLLALWIFLGGGSALAALALLRAPIPLPPASGT